MRVKIVERRIRWNPALDFKHLALSPERGYRTRVRLPDKSGTDSLVGPNTSSTPLSRLEVLSLFGRDYPVLSLENQMHQGHENRHEKKRVQTTVIRCSNEGVNWDSGAQ